MNALEFLHQIQKSKLTFVQTRDVADILRISTHSAGKYLEQLKAQNFIEKVCRGKWVINGAGPDPMQVAEFITAPLESYISLHSALFHHGMIEQVPGRIYSVTVDRSKVVKTPIGVYSFHHCNPEFFLGYQYIRPYLKIATPEKALVDYFYFTPTKSREFTKLPELEIPKTFSWKRVREYCEAIPSVRNRSLVKTRISGLLNRT